MPPDVGGLVHPRTGAADSRGEACIGKRETRGVARERFMQDVIYIAASVLFFVVAIAYVEFCDRLK